MKAISEKEDERNFLWKEFLEIMKELEE